MDNSEYLINSDNMPIDNTLFLLHYIIFMPVVVLVFALLLRYLRRQGFIDKGTSEEMLTQCNSVLRNVNVALNSGSDNSNETPTHIV